MKRRVLFVTVGLLLPAIAWAATNTHLLCPLGFCPFCP